MTARDTSAAWTGPYNEGYFEAVHEQPAKPSDAPPRPYVLPTIAQRPGLDFRPAADIEAPEGVDEYLIDGVLRPRAFMILAAAEGVGKSYVRLELGVRLALGDGALFGHYPIVRKARTMVLNVENDPAEEYERERQVFARLDVERAQVRDYLRADARDFRLAAGEAALDAQLIAHRPDVLIIDTGTSAVDDEWGTGLKETVRILRRLIDRHNVAVIVLVHLTKPPKEPGRTTHGTSLAAVMGQWTRQADAVALMADLSNGRAQWTMRKRVPHSSIVIAQDAGLWQYVSAVSERRASNDDRVLRAIAAGAGDEGAIRAALGTPERPMARQTFYDAARRLRVAGLIEDGTPYRLTGEGMEAVA